MATTVNPYTRLQNALSPEQSAEWSVGDILTLFRRTLETLEDVATKRVIAEQFKAWSCERNFVIGLMNPVAVTRLERVQILIADIPAE